MNAPRRLLQIAYYFPPIGMAGVQRPVKMAKYLPEFGWDVWTLTVRSIAYFAQDADLLADVREERVVRTGSLDPARLAYLLGIRGRSSRNAGNLSWCGRIMRKIARWVCMPDSKIFWVPFALVRAWRMHRQKVFDAILTTGSPTSAHLVGWLMHWWFGVPWVMDQRDFWDGNLRLQRKMGLDSLLRVALESFLVRRTNTVTVVSEELSRIAYTRGAPVVELIRNGYDSDDFSDISDAGETQKFIIVHGGTANKLNDIRYILKVIRDGLAAGYLPENEIEFHQMGTVLDMDLQAECEALNLHCVRQMPYCNHRQYIAALRRANLLVLSQSPDCRVGCIPGKIYEYLATGLPILCISDGGEAADLVQNFGYGDCVTVRDVGGAVRALERYYRAWKSGEQIVSQKSVEGLSRRTQARQMTNVLDELAEVATS